jgi:flagellar hook assembly protein FlgD
LYQNRPNPFNHTTQIGFGLDRGGRTLLQIYDISGKLVRTVMDDVVPEGWYSPIWDGRDASGRRVASGVYFYRLKSPSGILTRKLVVVK